MSPEQSQSPEMDDPKKRVQAMLGSITDAISGEDYEFASETALGQTLVSPADVIDYLHVQGKNEEDPVAQRRLRDGTVSIVAALRERDQAEVTSDSERSLTEEEVRRINDVVEEINLEAAVNDEPSTTDMPNIVPDQDVEPDYEWDGDVFSPDLSDYTDEEIEKAKNTPGFKAAMQTAQNSGYEVSGRLKAARELIEKNGGKYKDLQLVLLDEAISQAAEQTAQNNGYEISSRLKAARLYIERYASSPERAQAMLDEFGL